MLRNFLFVTFTLFVALLLSSFKDTGRNNMSLLNDYDTIPQVDDSKIVFEKAEVDASVDRLAWRRHLEQNLMPVIERAAKMKMPDGTYTVQVRFLVEKDGSISDIRALNNPGFGLAEGAVNVVKKGPRWNPGEHNGKKVRSYHTQPITFVIITE